MWLGMRIQTHQSAVIRAMIIKIKQKNMYMVFLFVPLFRLRMTQGALFFSLFKIQSQELGVNL